MGRNKRSVGKITLCNIISNIFFASVVIQRVIKNKVMSAMSLLLSKKLLKQARVEKQRKQNSKTVRINTIKALDTNQKLATTWGAFPQEKKAH